MRNIQFLLLFSFVLFLQTAQSLRVCKNEADYYKVNSANCWDNPSDQMNVTEVLRNLFGFYAEEHLVTTQDGYTLLLVRSYKNVTKNHPVILGHATMTNSLCFMAAMNKSLVYQLGTEGYDMWLVNFRGSKYSRKHIKYTVEEDSFWDFSFHEMGIYDVPAIVNYVNQITKIKALYVGFSMGTTSMLVYSSVKASEANEKILGSVFLGTAGIFVNKNSTLKKFDPSTSPLPYTAPVFKHGAVFYDSVTADTAVEVAVQTPASLKTFYKTVIGPFNGYSISSQYDPVTLPIILTIARDIITIRILRHYVQCINTGEFKYFDYGKKENIKRYNSTKPPIYPIGNIGFPVAMISANGDLITPIAGTMATYNQVKIKCGFFTPPDNLLTHIGMVFTKNIIDQINLPTIRYLKAMEDGDC